MKNITVNNCENDSSRISHSPLTPSTDEIKNVTRETRRRIGQQLKEARMAQNISVRSLAEQSGVDKSSICRIEAGRLNVGIDNLSRLAEIIGLKLVLVDA